MLLLNMYNVIVYCIFAIPGIPQSHVFSISPYSVFHSFSFPFLFKYVFVILPQFLIIRPKISHMHFLWKYLILFFSLLGIYSICCGLHTEREF